MRNVIIIILFCVVSITASDNKREWALFSYRERSAGLDLILRFGNISTADLRSAKLIGKNFYGTVKEIVSERANYFKVWVRKYHSNKMVAFSPDELCVAFVDPLFEAARYEKWISMRSKYFPYEGIHSDARYLQYSAKQPETMIEDGERREELNRHTLVCAEVYDDNVISIIGTSRLQYDDAAFKGVYIDYIQGRHLEYIPYKPFFTDKLACVQVLGEESDMGTAYADTVSFAYVNIKNRKLFTCGYLSAYLFGIKFGWFEKHMPHLYEKIVYGSMMCAQEDKSKIYGECNKYYFAPDVTSLFTKDDIKVLDEILKDQDFWIVGSKTKKKAPEIYEWINMQMSWGITPPRLSNQLKVFLGYQKYDMPHCTAVMSLSDGAMRYKEPVEGKGIVGELVSNYDAFAVAAEQQATFDYLKKQADLWKKSNWRDDTYKQRVKTWEKIMIFLKKERFKLIGRNDLLLKYDVLSNHIELYQDNNEHLAQTGFCNELPQNMNLSKLRIKKDGSVTYRSYPLSLTKTTQ